MVRSKPRLERGSLEKHLKEEVSREQALEAVRTLLRYIGDDPDREGLLETPDRVVRSFDHIYSGYRKNAREVLSKTFTSSTEEMVVLSNIELYSMCEHHMLPFTGKCHIGYIPKGKVLGISKLARVMEVYARRLQIQEELCHQIANAIYDELKPDGVGVVIEARHMCMTCRGVEKQHSVMTSSTLLGSFREDPRTRQEFFDLIRSNGN
ncbi:MAG: GTP cyclohydrolase I FolE [Spirochaetaceae bacterium]|nr:GTP cyclohydrolase I FolE [Spirochaetaceae bacterium]|tara:strand:- start:37070 stop:37693 length:624 start_codon:yes stop_codon:yes gene_type:complete